MHRILQVGISSGYNQGAEHLERVSRFISHSTQMYKLVCNSVSTVRGAIKSIVQPQLLLPVEAQEPGAVMLVC